MAEQRESLIHAAGAQQIENRVHRFSASTFAAVPVTEAAHRVFGGLLLAQSLIAAGTTVPASRRPHSLHASFLHGVDPGCAMSFEVERHRIRGLGPGDRARPLTSSRHR